MAWDTSKEKTVNTARVLTVWKDGRSYRFPFYGYLVHQIKDMLLELGLADKDDLLEKDGVILHETSKFRMYISHVFPEKDIVVHVKRKPWKSYHALDGKTIML